MGIIESKNLRARKDFDPAYKKVLDDFVRAITPGKPICDFHDKKKHHERGAVFVGLYNAFLSVMRGYGNLVRWEDKRDVLGRIRELRSEASYWTGINDKGINFSTNIDKIVEDHVPAADIERFNEEQREM